MSSRRTLRALLAVSLCALTATAGASAGDDHASRGIDPNQGLSLVEVFVPSKAAALRLQLQAHKYGVEFNEHYLRQNPDGSFTVTVFGTNEQLLRLGAAGYEVGTTIESTETWKQRMAERAATIRAEARAKATVRRPGKFFAHENTVVILRADYFENYAGRFLSVEAKARPGDLATLPSMALSWNAGADTPISSPARTMDVNIDPDTTPDTYIEHRELVRIGDVGTTSPAAPTRVRVASSAGGVAEGDVSPWLAGVSPKMKQDFLTGFTSRYLDPTELIARFHELAREFPNLAQMVALPYKTNGYQRRAQATMSGTNPPGNTVGGSTAQSQAVVLTSRSWGHEGGNDISAAFVNPNAPSSPLEVIVTNDDGGAVANDIVVRLGTDATGALSSKATDVIAAINAHVGASQLVAATTYRGNAGAGIVQPRLKVNLSDFLTTTTNAHVTRGPFTNYFMRISGRHGNNSKQKVGVFLYCQQHAREWATPLTCLETAEQLLRNYGTDARTKQIVDNLEIFILPSSNPDGAHYSMHNFTQQRRNMTNHCVNGGKTSDNPFATDFWTMRVNPGTGQPYTNNDPASRNAWGVDLNRNNTVGTIFDGYIGASYSCTSDTYAGPSEASEPEIRNELYIADTFKNIKFSNNIHSFGGYFMWAPGAYLPNRDEGALDHANIGVEKYFFAAGDRILNRIKDVRNTAILPERTGPIADVLYSAGGNSADEHWYNRGVIAYSFETGADRYVNTSLSAAATAGVNGFRAATRQAFGEGDRVVIEPGTANEEVVTVERVLAQNPPSPNPNVILTAPLTKSHPQGSVLAGGTLQQGVGFQPPYDTEGKFEALEFAAGNYGLLESALEYARDDVAPQVVMTGPYTSSGAVETTFVFVNEPSVIHYTTDGSAPTDASAVWDSSGPREPGEVFHVSSSTVFRWKATDMKGNVSFGSQAFTIGSN